MIDEKWVAIPGYEGFYEVSDHGRVRSVERAITDSHGRDYVLPQRVLRLESKAGYLYAALSVGNIVRRHRVHRLVLLAFVGPCPEGMEGCHENGDSHDNRPQNLRWKTRNDNAKDRVRHGTHNLLRKNRKAA